MATTNISDLIKKYCVLYKGGDRASNPYKPDAPGDQWAMEYLKFHIWDAEYLVVHRSAVWREDVEREQPDRSFTKEEMAEEIYKKAIYCKLDKIHREDIDFMKMYFEL